MDCDYDVDRYWNAALIEIKEDECWLIRSLNIDAEDPIQGEEYGPQWSLTTENACNMFESFGFWNTWHSISGRTTGGIYLYDGMSESEAKDFLGIGSGTPVFNIMDKHIPELVKSLSPGRYVVIPM